MAKGREIDTATCRRHLQQIRKNQQQISKKLAPLYHRKRSSYPHAADSDHNLYNGFLTRADRQHLDTLRGMSAQKLAAANPTFSDKRLNMLVWRYRARNYPETLSPDEQRQWLQHCLQRLTDASASGGLTLDAYFSRLQALAAEYHEDSNKRQQLDAMRRYGEALQQKWQP
ncbi:MAG: hypothetical protein HQL49_11045 [Gammaproteobacteria bacterium]|nr:hypothetical protein [Gammaproteobacteria bacterium]